MKKKIFDIAIGTNAHELKMKLSLIHKWIIPSRHTGETSSDVY